MKPITIYLADLTHTGGCIASEQVPLNIALVGSYAKKIHGDKITIRLFKFPDKLLKAIRDTPPDILAVSNYAWNYNLAEWACRKAKKANRNVLTIKGGWNFPIDSNGRLNFLRKYRSTDIYVINEGELAFSAVLDVYIKYGRTGVLSRRIPGTCYLDSNQNRLIVGDRMPDVMVLDDIPSPYTNGMLDEFLDGSLNPIVETTRGCPFKCNYCNSAADDYNKIRRFTFDYLRKDFEYISEIMSKTDNRIIMIPDANFGMYKQDKQITELLASMRLSRDWPHVVFVVGSGKGNQEFVLEALAPVKDSIAPSLAFQSFNDNTLKEINRKNIISSSFSEISNKANEIGFTIHSELIVPLPYETLDSYLTGLRTLMNYGPKKISTYTLQLNYGTPYREDDYLKKHGIVAKYRPIIYAYGKYDGEMVLEVESVAVGTNDMSFEDYVIARCFTFLTEVIYNNDIFFEFVKLLNERGHSSFDLIKIAYSESNNISGPISDVIESFINDTKSELADTEEDIYSFYSQDDNYDRMVKGEIGANVIFKHKTWLLSQHIIDLSRFVSKCARKLYEENLKPNELDESINCPESIRSVC